MLDVLGHDRLQRTVNSSDRLGGLQSRRAKRAASAIGLRFVGNLFDDGGVPDDTLNDLDRPRCRLLGLGATGIRPAKESVGGAELVWRQRNAVCLPHTVAAYFATVASSAIFAKMVSNSPATDFNSGLAPARYGAKTAIGVL